MNAGSATHWMAGFTLAGGLALFLLGMQFLGQGLRWAAGDVLRQWLQRSARYRATGLLVGMLVGTLLHAGPTALMVTGFLHAGLVTLEQSLPLILGACVGTTLTTQLIAFRLGDYAYIPLAVGVLMFLLGGRSRTGSFGQALAGLGLLFVGLNTMGAGVGVFRADLAHLFGNIHGNTALGLLVGASVALAVSLALQSGKAVIGMIFALAATGAIGNLSQTYPVILGAHIGMCSPTVLGSLGMNIEARRAALAMVIFNILGAFAGAGLAPLMYDWVPALGGDVIRQTANAELLKMLAFALAALPFTALFARALRRWTPSSEPPVELGHLDDRLCARPEDALAAALAELRRTATLCRQSHHEAGEVMLRRNLARIRRINQNEVAVDETKRAIKAYLQRLARRYLSQRQALLLMDVDQIVIELERIHDHLKVLSTLSQRRYNRAGALFFREDLDGLFALYREIGGLLAEVESLLDPAGAPAARVPGLLRRVARYRARHAEVVEAYTARLAEHRYLPESGIFFHEYAETFRRIARHGANIARTVYRTEFHLKPSKIGRRAPPPPPYLAPTLVNVDEYLKDQVWREGAEAEPEGSRA